MTDFEHETEVPVSAYGAQRRAAWLAHHQANADMAKSAELAAYGASEDRRVTQAGQAGLYDHMTPQEKGAAVAARQARVGDDWGQGRDLRALGGTVDPGSYLCSPVPPQRDMRFVNQPGGAPAADAESSLARFMRERQQ